MMRKIEKFLGAARAFALALALILTCFPRSAFAVASAPKDGASGVPLPNLSFIGAKAARLEASTTPAQIVTGTGLLYSLCVFGTTAVPGAASLAYDTNDTSPIAAGILTVLAEMISPVVYGTAYATGSILNPAALVGCWTPPVPVRFEKGLVLVNNGTTFRTLALYRLDTGVNP